MLQREVLVRERLAAVDTRRARPITIKEIPSLAHKVFNLEVRSSSQSQAQQVRANEFGVSSLVQGVWSMLTTRWNLLPLYPCGRPRLLLLSPVQNCRKFSAVLGTTSAKSSNWIRPRGSPAVWGQFFDNHVMDVEKGEKGSVQGEKFEEYEPLSVISKNTLWKSVRILQVWWWGRGRRTAGCRTRAVL
jgi:hypothetical protein